jgi:uncharacterized protein
MKYKFSNYNFFIPYNDIIIAFNAIAGSIITIGKETFSILNKLDIELGELKEKNEKLFNNMLKSRFIINEDFDEISLMKFRTNRDIYIYNVYQLILCPTMECNFGCWYCYQSREKGKMSKKLMDSIILHIKDKIKNHSISGLALSWFGGEPMMYFDDIMYPLAKELKKISDDKELKFIHSITTNGYLVSDKNIERMKELDLSRLQITLDGIEEIHDKSRTLKSGLPTFKKIIDNINLICSTLEKPEITLRINYKNEALLNLNEIIKYFPEEHRKFITVDFQRIWQTTEEYLHANKHLKEKIDEFQNAGFSQFLSSFYGVGKGHTCYADRYHEAIINYDGHVYKCTARDFKKENSYGFMNEKGEIVWDLGKVTKRLEKTIFDYDKCVDCKALPLCVGPCSQKRLEIDNIERTCIQNTSEVTIEDYIISYYKRTIKENEISKRK